MLTESLLMLLTKGENRPSVLPYIALVNEAQQVSRDAIARAEQAEARIEAALAWTEIHHTPGWGFSERLLGILRGED